MAIVRDRAATLLQCWSIHVCVGSMVAWCLVEGSLGSFRFNDPKHCSNARVILKKVILCTKKVSQAPWSLHTPASCREDDAHAGPWSLHAEPALAATVLGCCPPACPRR